MTKDRLLKALGALPLVLAIAYFALWACAPASTVRAPAPMPVGEPAQLGVGVSGITNLNAQANDEPLDEQFFGPNAWALYRFGGESEPTRADKETPEAAFFLDIGTNVSASFQQTDEGSVSGGVLLRLGLIMDSDFVLAVDVEAGWLYGTLALPFGFEIDDGLWLYSSPSVLAGVAFERGALRLPIGLAVHKKNTVLTFELGPAFFPSNAGGNPDFGLVGGLGVAFH